MALEYGKPVIRTPEASPEINATLKLLLERPIATVKLLLYRPVETGKLLLEKGFP